MSVKAHLEVLVKLQRGELELLRIDGEIAALERRRADLKAEIEHAQAVVDGAEKELEEARAAARRLEGDLQAAEDKVRKFKDHLLSVKTNKELWALQEEIATAEKGVGAVETQILEQLEAADSGESVIGQGRADLEATKARVAAGNAETDRAQGLLDVERANVAGAIAELRSLLPGDLAKQYEGVKAARGGIAMGEALGEICLACNTRMRPQLYVEIFNLEEVVRCENCRRLLYVAERLDLPAPTPAAEEPEVAGAPASATPTAESPGAAGNTPTAATSDMPGGVVSDATS